MIGIPVYVIDDDEAMRDSLVLLLRAEGFTARAFAGGKAFFAALPNDPETCIITDIRMPEIDGTELVRRVNELRGNRWPIIVITGHADVPLAVKLMKSGIVDFIEKPFDPARLIEIVRGCLRQLIKIKAENEEREAVQRRMALLTGREVQVFKALVDGKSNKEIAQDLEISPRTVEIFRAKVMTKMEADSLSALVRMAVKSGDL